MVYVWYNERHLVIALSCIVNAERITFVWYQLIVMFLLPVIVITFCYVVVIRVLWRSTVEHARMTGNSSLRSVKPIIGVFRLQLLARIIRAVVDNSHRRPIELQRRAKCLL